MTSTIQLRRDTAANWTAANTVLAIGEPGVELGTRKVKIGDGVTPWNGLDYSIGNPYGVIGPAGPAGPQGPQGPSGAGTAAANTLTGTTLAANVVASSLASLGVQSAPLAMGGNAITGLPAPTANGQPLRFDMLAAASGVATLDSGGKIPIAQIPASVLGAMNYQGTWNALTNTPALASGVGTKGFYYKVATAGTTAIDGNSQWNVQDLIAFDGTTWDKIDGIASEVTSVAGRTGAVVLSQADISGLPVGTLAILGANTFTGQQTYSLAGAASTPPNVMTGTWFTGGTTTTTKPQLLIEPTGTTSTNWSTSGTGLGINAATGFAGNLIDTQVNGASRFTVRNDGNTFFIPGASVYDSGGGNFGMNYNTAGEVAAKVRFAMPVVSPDTFMLRAAAATLQYGAADAAAPVAQTLKFQDVVAGTTNTAGVNATISAPSGTGTGAGGDLIFTSAKAGTTGSTKNAQVEAFAIKGTGPVVRLSGGGVTVANLPAAVDGGLGFVTDSTMAAGAGIGTTVVGGGANKRLVYGAGGSWLLA